jgi:ABC-type taurine transport system ATPase subunit
MSRARAASSGATARFVHRFAQGEDAAAVRSDPAFIALREEIRTLIHDTETPP